MTARHGQVRPCVEVDQNPVLIAMFVKCLKLQFVRTGADRITVYVGLFLVK